MSEVPPYLKKHIQDARRLFGVGGPEWHVCIELDDKKLDADIAGMTVANGVYMNATITFPTDIQDDEAARVNAFHEVLHVAMEPVDLVVRRMLDELPESIGDLYRAFYADAVENFVQRMARSICAHLRDDSVSEAADER